MAPKTKQKEIHSTNKQSKSKPMPSAGSGPNPDDVARRVAWEKEIRSLVDLKPASIEQAVSMLIDSVVGKMGVPSSAQVETKEFLQELFDTDPALKNLVRAALKL